MYDVRKWHSNVQNVHCKISAVETEGRLRVMLKMCPDEINAFDLCKWNFLCKSRRTLFSLRRRTSNGLSRQNLFGISRRTLN